MKGFVYRLGKRKFHSWICTIKVPQKIACQLFIFFSTCLKSKNISTYLITKKNGLIIKNIFSLDRFRCRFTLKSTVKAVFKVQFGWQRTQQKYVWENDLHNKVFMLSSKKFYHVHSKHITQYTLQNSILGKQYSAQCPKPKSSLRRINIREPNKKLFNRYPHFSACNFKSLQKNVC